MNGKLTRARFYPQSASDKRVRLTQMDYIYFAAKVQIAIESERLWPLKFVQLTACRASDIFPDRGMGV